MHLLLKFLTPSLPSDCDTIYGRPPPQEQISKQEDVSIAQTFLPFLSHSLVDQLVESGNRTSHRQKQYTVVCSFILDVLKLVKRHYCGLFLGFS